MLKNEPYHAKVLPKSSHLNGQQTQKLELHYMSPQLTLGMKRLKKGQSGEAEITMVSEEGQEGQQNEY